MFEYTSALHVTTATSNSLELKGQHEEEVLHEQSVVHVLCRLEKLQRVLLLLLLHPRFAELPNGRDVRTVPVLLELLSQKRQNDGMADGLEDRLDQIGGRRFRVRGGGARPTREDEKWGSTLLR